MSDADLLPALQESSVGVQPPVLASSWITIRSHSPTAPATAASEAAARDAANVNLACIVNDERGQLEARQLGRQSQELAFSGASAYTPAIRS